VSLEPTQSMTIAADAVAFTAVCEACVGIDIAAGLSVSRFAGRLDADLGAGIFLCRRGHAIRIVRSLPENRSETAAVEAA
jgi:hypothetical protein